MCRLHLFLKITQKLKKKLETDHNFLWSAAEKNCSKNFDDHLLLSNAIQRKTSAPVQLFEIFFSREIKNYIIEASKENSLQLSIEELNNFVDILLLSSYNIRNDQREY